MFNRANVSICIADYVCSGAVRRPWAVSVRTTLVVGTVTAALLIAAGCSPDGGGNAAGGPRPPAAVVPVSAAAPAAQLLSAPVHTKVGRETERIVAADFDGDRRAEVVVAKRQAGAIGPASTTDTNGLLRPSESGSRQESLDGGGEIMTVADLDGDGALDLVAGDRIGRLAAYRGLGVEGLAPPVQLSADGSGLVHIAVVDVDADSDLDLVAVKESTENASVLRNDGRGTFAPPARSSRLVAGLSTATAIDLHGDGSADLVVGGHQGLFVVPNDGTGRFGDPTPIPDTAPFRYPAVATAADLNLDGVGDLLYTSQELLHVRLGTGDGGFEAERYLPMSGDRVAVGDLNGDTFPDLVSGGSFGDGIVVALGDGTGDFGAPLTQGHPRLQVADLAIADIDGDCAPDVVVGDHQKRVAVLRNTTERPCPPGMPVTAHPGPFFAVTADGGESLPGGGELVPSVFSKAGRNGLDPVLADVDEDGHLDLVVNGWYERRITIRRGAPDGTFAAEAKHVSVPALAQPEPEPCNDVFSKSVGGPVVLGARGMSVGPVPTVAASCAARDDVPAGLQVADLDRDGNLDLVTGTSHGNSIAVLRGDGRGNFEAQRRYGTGTAAQVDLVVDLTGDSAPDVVSGRTVMVNDGAGGLKRGQRLPIPVSRVTAADLDGDQDLDLIALNTEGRDDELVVLTNDGRARFERGESVQIRLQGGNRPVQLTVADRNGDDRPDLIVVPERRPAVLVLDGDGRGGFGASRAIRTGVAAGGLAVGDVSGDGRPDLAVAGPEANAIVLLIATGKGGYEPPVRIRTDLAPRAVFLVDIDGDDTLDVVTFHGKPQGVSVRFVRP